MSARLLALGIDHRLAWNGRFVDLDVLFCELLGVAVDAGTS